MTPMGIIRLAAPLMLAGCASLGGDRVLTEADFARMQVGMTQEDARRLLGSPPETMNFPRLAQRSWDYLFEDAWGFTVRYSIIFGFEGTMVGRAYDRLNDGDYGQ